MRWTHDHLTISPNFTALEILRRTVHILVLERNAWALTCPVAESIVQETPVLTGRVRHHVPVSGLPPNPLPRRRLLVYQPTQQRIVGRPDLRSSKRGT